MAVNHPVGGSNPSPGAILSPQKPSSKCPQNRLQRNKRYFNFAINALKIISVVCGNTGGLKIYRLSITANNPCYSSPTTDTTFLQNTSCTPQWLLFLITEKFLSYHAELEIFSCRGFHKLLLSSGQFHFNVGQFSPRLSDIQEFVTFSERCCIVTISLFTIHCISQDQDFRTPISGIP